MGKWGNNWHRYRKTDGKIEKEEEIKELKISKKDGQRDIDGRTFSTFLKFIHVIKNRNVYSVAYYIKNYVT